MCRFNEYLNFSFFKLSFAFVFSVSGILATKIVYYHVIHTEFREAQVMLYFSVKTHSVEIYFVLTRLH